MKMCMTHWNELRDKIRALGLYGLVATSGEQAAAQLVKQIDSGPSKANFDPLMGAHNAIWSNAMGVAGIAVMQPNEDGSERCPLCYLVQSCACGRADACPFLTWTTRATDDMKAEAIRLGLVGTDQADQKGSVTDG